MKDKHDASHSILGYLYQIERALFLLLNKPDSEVTLEHIDDVVFENNDSSLDIIQMKHHISKKGSLGDTSTDFWKTLDIWMDNYSKTKDNPNESFRILMTTDSSLSGSATQMLSSRIDLRNEEEALEILEKKAKDEKNQSNKTYYQKFLKFEKHDRRNLLKTIQIMDNTPDIIKTREEILKKLRINSRSEHLEQFFDRVWGLWVNMVTDILYSNSKSTISYNELNSHIQDIRDQFTQESLPIDFLHKDPTATEIIGYKDRIFVKQLEWIVSNDELIGLAIIDYWKAYQQRSRWVKDELLFDKELIDYEKRLQDTWKKKFLIKIEELSINASPEKKRRKGLELFNWASSNTGLCIREKCTEPYVTHGSFHILAEQMKIGWHPDFREKLKKLFNTDVIAFDTMGKKTT